MVVAMLCMAAVPSAQGLLLVGENFNNYPDGDIVGRVAPNGQAWVNVHSSWSDSPKVGTDFGMSSKGVGRPRTGNATPYSMAQLPVGDLMSMGSEVWSFEADMYVDPAGGAGNRYTEAGFRQANGANLMVQVSKYNAPAGKLRLSVDGSTFGDKFVLIPASVSGWTHLQLIADRTTRDATIMWSIPEEELSGEWVYPVKIPDNSSYPMNYTHVQVWLDGNNGKFAVDNIKVYPGLLVPEPGSMLALAAGLASFGWRRRRS